MIRTEDAEFLAYCLRMAGNHFRHEAEFWEDVGEDDVDAQLAASYRDQVERCNSLIYQIEIYEEDEDDA